MAKALRKKDLKEMSPAELAAELRADIARFTKVIADAKIPKLD